MAKKYPQIEVMIGGESTILRDMTAEEKDAFDFFSGEQWTPEQVADIRRINGERTH